MPHFDRGASVLTHLVSISPGEYKRLIYTSVP